MTPRLRFAAVTEVIGDTVAVDLDGVDVEVVYVAAVDDVVALLQQGRHLVPLGAIV